MSGVSTRVLLLIEDNPGDARLVRELLDDSSGGYSIIHAPRLADGVEALRRAEVDVVVLDLRLPDCSGVDTVRVVREAARKAPIVVLTGADDERLALDCIHAGAQDYLSKSEVKSSSLRRAIGYAVTRIRETQLRELQDTLERYRSLSSASAFPSVTAALAGSGAVSTRSPEAFDRITADYYRLLEPYLNREADAIEAPRTTMERIATALGDASGGPRDLLDVHLQALNRALEGRDDAHSRSVVYEARLLALEMMGLLVDYYRVGHRRRFVEGARS